MNVSSIDIFCHVIDNFGDAGVAYRFATGFKRFHPDCRVRVFIDDTTVLANIDPSIIPGHFRQECNSIEYIDSSRIDAPGVETLGCADVLVELFGCYTPDCYLDVALFSTPLIINLEYLSAEGWGAGYHRRESLLPKGTAKKYFFMPGFTTDTGGLLFNTKIFEQRHLIDANRTVWINALLYRSGAGVVITDATFVGTVFTYERGFDTLITSLDELCRETVLLCFGRKSRNGMAKTLERLGASDDDGPCWNYGKITVVCIPNIPQDDFDLLLHYVDFNLVRGEDSLVQALLAGKPFIWNAYLQDDKYQQVKVEALCAEIAEYFDDAAVFTSYRELLIQFNDAATESPLQTTLEHYEFFFRDLKKIEHATTKMSYFIRQNCNLVQKFSEFIRDFPKNTQ